MGTNRELKFRAWDKHTKQWITKEGFHLFGEVTCFGLVESWLDEHPREDEDGKRMSTLIRFNDVETPQWTGINGRSGNEIYECDIVNIWQRLSEHKDGFANTEVKFEYGQWNICDSSIFTLQNGCEVVGNIYENPKLIK